MRRVVGEVGVHLEEHVVPALQTPSESRDVSGSESELPFTVYHVCACVCAGELLGDSSGSVRRGIIDDQYLEPWILREHQGNETWNVLRLVVGRDYDESALQA